MYILYKGNMSNTNIVGYFADYNVILGSIKLSYSGIKEAKFRETLYVVEVMLGANVIDRFIYEPIFIRGRIDHI